MTACCTSDHQSRYLKLSAQELEQALNLDPGHQLLLEEIHYRLLPERPRSFGEYVVALHVCYAECMYKLQSNTVNLNVRCAVAQGSG